MNLKHAPILIGLFILCMFFYACESMLLHSHENYDETFGGFKEDTPQGFDVFTALGILLDFFGFMVGLFFLKMPNISWYLSIFLYPLYVILLFGFWVFLIDLIFDISDFLKTIKQTISPLG